MNFLLCIAIIALLGLLLWIKYSRWKKEWEEMEKGWDKQGLP